jgi:antitoxin HicB
VTFPDLPGCVAQVDDLAELPDIAERARKAWITSAYRAGVAVQPPSRPTEYSGRFNLRLPRSLHRTLVESAEREGVSLNQYVLMLLAQQDTLKQVEGKLIHAGASGSTREHGLSNAGGMRAVSAVGASADPRDG